MLQTISKEQDSDKEIVVPDNNTDRQVKVVEVGLHVYFSYDKHWDYIETLEYIFLRKMMSFTFDLI